MGHQAVVADCAPALSTGLTWDVVPAGHGRQALKRAAPDSGHPGMSGRGGSGRSQVASVHGGAWFGAGWGWWSASSVLRLPWPRSFGFDATELDGFDAVLVGVDLVGVGGVVDPVMVESA